MKLRKILKRGFTLVELVVVIAVIAILAAVSVVTYMSITKKAKESADFQLVDEVNRCLVTYETLNHGKKPANMHEALKAVEENGFKVEKFAAPATDSEFAYSLKEDKFVLFSNGEVTYPTDFATPAKHNDLWRFTDTLSGLEDYSYYLRNNEVSGTVTVSAGFDVGENKNISSISYLRSTATEEQTSVVRTNGGNLTINAPLDTVNHYGEGIVLNISAIKSESYHEYGYFPKASIAQGRIVVEESGKLPEVEVTAVPTQQNPVIIETSKDIKVGASESLGGEALDYVEVKVSGSSASVIVDESISTENIEINGQAAQAQDFVSITNVSNYSELSAAITAMKPYIRFTDDIAYATNGSGLLNVLYSVTIDGNGHTLSGYGARVTSSGSQPTTIALNNGGSSKIDVVFENITITSPAAKGRPVEARGNLNSLTIKNSTISTTAVANNQVVTIGGSQSFAAKVLIENSTISASRSGYPIISFNPMNLEINNSTIDGYCGVYFKSDTYGAQNCTVVANNSVFNSPNSYDAEGANSFGVFTFEQGVSNNSITLNNCKVNNQQNGTAYQALVTFSDQTSAYYVNNKVTINGSDSYINGLLTLNAELAMDSKLTLNAGTYTYNPLSDDAEASGIKIVELGSGKNVYESSEFNYVVR